MKTKIILAAALMFGAASNMYALEPADTTARPFLSTEDLNKARNAVADDGTAQWFVDMSYAGFDFQLPAGTVVEKNSSLVAKYPDGSFGVSMSNVEKRGSNQDLAFKLCRQLATSMHLSNPKVQKVTFGKCKGAKASGVLEGQEVTVLVLPYSGQEVTTVILATPNRTDWVDHFLRTLSR